MTQELNNLCGKYRFPASVWYHLVSLQLADGLRENLPRGTMNPEHGEDLILRSREPGVKFMQA
jgi:hypothetical protein